VDSPTLHVCNWLTIQASDTAFIEKAFDIIKMDQPLLPAHSYTSSSTPFSLATARQQQQKPTIDPSFLPGLRACCVLLGLMAGAFTQLSDVSAHVLKILLPLMTDKQLNHGMMEFDALWSFLSSAVVVTFITLVRGICICSVKQVDRRAKISIKWIFEMDVWYGMGAVVGLCLAFYAVNGAAIVPLWLWFLGPFVSCTMFGGAMYLCERCVGLEDEDDDEEQDESGSKSKKLRTKANKVLQGVDYGITVV
jgi:hypothetical protein